MSTVCHLPTMSAELVDRSRGRIANLPLHQLERDESRLPTGDDVVTTYFGPEGRPETHGACQNAYEITVPDDHPAGLYWYHTHFHGESEAQTLLGLSGAIVVENGDDDARRRHEIADRKAIS
jgi:Multicopper oxidase